MVVPSIRGGLQSEGITMIEVEHEKSVQHRLMACEWDERAKKHGHPGDEKEDEHVLCAADFVVDEFELYGLGD